MLLNGDEEDEVFQPPRKSQRLESVVRAVPAKAANAVKAPPPTADWLTGALSQPKRGGWSRGWGRGGGFRGNRGKSGGRGGGRGRRNKSGCLCMQFFVF